MEPGFQLSSADLGHFVLLLHTEGAGLLGCINDIEVALCDV